MSIYKSQVRFCKVQRIEADYFKSKKSLKRKEEAFMIGKGEHRKWKERLRDEMRKETEAGADRLDLLCCQHKAIKSTYSAN